MQAIWNQVLMDAVRLLDILEYFNKESCHFDSSTLAMTFKKQVFCIVIWPFSSYCFDSSGDLDSREVIPSASLPLVNED